ncbi:hypothetical protein V8J08_000927 [Citrobacter amalonaticus]|uniref:hypothetical protein n=1 Tax=Citrobacter sp. CFNIH10 TaxID=1920110 RepID=UPI000CEC4476|nr:hypothetical protein [Citrobacter sp. CFNIH10]AUZ67096.1 hypothetical protein C2U53_26505 [Citrobacter sp. CFNIH10]
MVNENELRARRNMIILMANGMPEALVMDADKLDDRMNDLFIEKIGCRNFDSEKEEANYVAGVEMMMFVDALQRLTRA